MSKPGQTWKQRWAGIPMILAIAVAIGLVLMTTIDSSVLERERVAELKSDMLTLNRTIETMNDRQAIYAVIHMEKRLLKAEQQMGNEQDLKVQRVLGESTFILLDLQESLKDRKLKKSDYPQKKKIIAPRHA